MKIRVVIFLLILSSSIYSQTYNGVASPLFFGRQASAKTEAMGKILSLNFDPYFTSQSNPAELISVEGASAFYSHSSSPYYIMDKANFYFGGTSVNLKELGAFAFNIQWVDWGSFVITSSTSPKPIGWYRMTTKLYTFTYANRLLNYFNFGLNANFFIEDFGIDKPYKGTFFELGITKNFNVLDETKINDNLLFGIQMKNIFNQSIEFLFEQENGDNIKEKEAFPSIFRIGISNEFKYSNEKIYKHSHLFGLTTGVEYQDVLNSKYYTAYKFGAELSLLNTLYLRMGYYYRTSDNHGFNANKSYMDDFTYGFGLNLNLENYLVVYFPMSIKINYVNLKQPSAVTHFDSWNNFTAFDIIINYRFN